MPAFVAGIDIGTRSLDANLEPGDLAQHFPNDETGRLLLVPLRPQQAALAGPRRRHAQARRPRRRPPRREPPRAALPTGARMSPTHLHSFWESPLTSNTETAEHAH